MNNIEREISTGRSEKAIGAALILSGISGIVSAGIAQNRDSNSIVFAGIYLAFASSVAAGVACLNRAFSRINRPEQARVHPENMMFQVNINVTGDIEADIYPTRQTNMQR